MEFQSSRNFDDFVFEDLDDYDNDEECVQLTSEPHTVLSVDPLAILPVDHPPEYYLRERTRKRRRRRATNPSFMAEIRVYRKDIRRRYSEMFVNVSNNHDLQLFKRFIDEFFRPDCQVIQVTPFDHELSRVIEQIIRNGVDKGLTSLKEFFYAYALHIEMRPDVIVKLMESQVRVRQGYRGSVVVTKFLMKGTQIMTVQDNTTQQIFKSLLSCAEYLKDDSVSSYELTIDSELKHDKVEVPWTPVIPPIETIGEMIFIMTLDESNQVQRFHIEYHPISEKPVTYTI